MTERSEVTVRVYGASDDLIEVEGGINEEFSSSTAFDGERDGGLLAFSDGTVLEVIYGEGNKGYWRIRRLVKGTAMYTLDEATDEDSDYSDRAILTGDLRWVVCGKALAQAK